jgi:hypothetical protein
MSVRIIKQLSINNMWVSVYKKGPCGPFNETRGLFDILNLLAHLLNKHFQLNSRVGHFRID